MVELCEMLGFIVTQFKYYGPDYNITMIAMSTCNN